MRPGIASLGARLLLHLQSFSGQPHPGQMRPNPVEYTSLAFPRSLITRSYAAAARCPGWCRTSGLLERRT
jgi:hypothetical protein